MTESQRTDLRGLRDETEAKSRPCKNVELYLQKSRLLLNYFNLDVRGAMYAEQIVG